MAAKVFRMDRSVNVFIRDSVLSLTAMAGILLSGCNSSNGGDSSDLSGRASAPSASAPTSPSTTTTTTSPTSPTGTGTGTTTRPVPVPTPTATPTPTPTTTPTTGLTGTAAIDAEEQIFLGLINAYRAQNGAPALTISVKLTQASDWLSVDMATRNYFSHTDRLGRAFSSRIGAFGYSGYTIAENIAAGNASGQATFTQWKNSSGHNANMLNANYKAIGIARAYDSTSSYKWYWTTDFGATVEK